MKSIRKREHILFLGTTVSGHASQCQVGQLGSIALARAMNVSHAVSMVAEQNVRETR